MTSASRPRTADGEEGHPQRLRGDLLRGVRGEQEDHRVGGGQDGWIGSALQSIRLRCPRAPAANIRLTLSEALSHAIGGLYRSRLGELLIQVILAGALAVPFFFRRVIATRWRRIRGGGVDAARRGPRGHRFRALTGRWSTRPRSATPPASSSVATASSTARSSLLRRRLGRLQSSGPA